MPAPKVPFFRRLAPFLLGYCTVPVHALNTDPTGGGVPVEHIQPGLVLRQIYLTQGLFPSPGNGDPGNGGDNGFNLIGDVRTFASPAELSSACPDANGKTLPISSNQANFAIIGTTFGGNGQTTFSIPDLRGRFAVQTGQGDALSPVELGQVFGAASDSLVPANLPAHRHSFEYIETTFTGEGAPFNSIQPSLGLSYLINANAEIRLYAGNFAPSGWAFAHGQVLPIASYPGLFNLIGTTYGGNGTSNFALPDLRGRVPVGAGEGEGLTPRAAGATFGGEQTWLSIQNLPSHTHTVSGVGTTAGTFQGQAFSTAQPSLVVHFGIAAEGVYPSGSNPFSAGVPVIGEILTFASETMPQGILPADGRLLPIFEYEALFTLIGTTYGGDGESVFALPDLRGRTPVAPGTLGGTPRVLGEEIGAETHVLTTGEMPPHIHSFDLPDATFVNGSFEQDHYTVTPGYTAQNGNVITGWKRTGNVGLNPAAGSPFANNGAVPHGSAVAFLQSANNTEATLGTTLTGLTPGLSYTVSFRVNCRDYNGNLPSPSWSLDGGPFMPFTVSAPVGGTNPYLKVSGVFIARGGFASITVKNRTLADSALLVDHFTIAAGTDPAWSVAPWTNDSSTGISVAATQWLYGLGSIFPSPWSINGVPGVGLTSINPQVADRLQITGFTNTATDNNDVSGGGGLMNRQFHFGANPGTIVIKGLSPGTPYRFSLFGVGFDENQARRVCLTSDSRQLVLDENLYGDNKGLRIDHSFVATATTRTILIQPLHSGFTFHLYGLALSTDLPEILVEDQSGNPVPAIVDFGNVSLPSSSGDRYFTIRNQGTMPLAVSSIALASGDAGEFQVEATGLPTTIAAGGYYGFKARLVPASFGERQATLRISSNDLDESTFDFTLKGTGIGYYSDWASDQFLSGAFNPAIGGKGADPDRDGLVNLLEYALRTDPKASNSPAFGLPVPVTLPGDVPALRFTLPYRDQAPDLHCRLQRSTNLSSWTDVWHLYPGSVVIPAMSGVSTTKDVSAQTFTITISNPALLQNPGYWRVKVE